MHLQFSSQDISSVVELTLMMAAQVALKGVEAMEHLEATQFGPVPSLAAHQ